MILQNQRDLNSNLRQQHPRVSDPMTQTGSAWFVSVTFWITNRPGVSTSGGGEQSSHREVALGTHIFVAVTHGVDWDAIGHTETTDFRFTLG